MLYIMLVMSHEIMMKMLHEILIVMLYQYRASLFDCDCDAVRLLFVTRRLDRLSTIDTIHLFSTGICNLSQDSALAQQGLRHDNNKNYVVKRTRSWSGFFSLFLVFLEG